MSVSSDLVRSVFLARPVNAHDFCQLVSDSTGYAAAFLSTLQFEVPVGYVAVLRSFAVAMYQSAGLYAIPSNAGVVASPCKNAQAQVYANFPLDPVFAGTGAERPCWVVADERMLLGVQVTYPLAPITTVTRVTAQLIGTLIPKLEGVSSQFAIGSLS